MIYVIIIVTILFLISLGLILLYYFHKGTKNQDPRETGKEYSIDDDWQVFNDNWFSDGIEHIKKVILGGKEK